MKKKAIGILVCMLLFISTVLSASGNIAIQQSIVSTSFVPTTWYVGGGGPNNFTSIQDAIDAASNGDTVFVYNGTYNEYITVDKSLTIIGEGRDSTIIDARSFDSVIRITANFVNISGFTLQNGGEYDPGIYVRSNYNSIVDNKIMYCGENGMTLQSSHNNTISGNIFSSNDEDGIQLLYADDNNISENTIASHRYYGIIVQYSHRNTFSGNTFTDNADGLHLWSFSSNNTVFGNNFTDNWGRSINIRYTYDNVIARNNVSFTYYGIWLDHVNGCIIKENTIFENTFGIHVDTEASSNTFFHNNLINNTDYNSYDMNNNTWDDEYPSGGNYWSDFDESDEGAWDNNSDGIVDSPYDIPGGSNQDKYPLIYPWGINKKPVANFTYTPEHPKRNENIQFTDTSIDPDGSIVSWWWDFDNGFYSNLQHPTYSYSEDGSYYVSLTVTDDDNAQDSTTTLVVVTTGNNPPSAPIISGQTYGKPGVEYTYQILAVDPDGDNVSYYIDWADGTVEDWAGPYQSGVPILFKHTWEEQDNYLIRAKAKDIHGLEGDWGALEVAMPNTHPSITMMTGILNLFN